MPHACASFHGHRHVGSDVRACFIARSHARPRKPHIGPQPLGVTGRVSTVGCHRPSFRRVEFEAVETAGETFCFVTGELSQWRSGAHDHHRCRHRTADSSSLIMSAAPALTNNVAELQALHHKVRQMQCNGRSICWTTTIAGRTDRMQSRSLTHVLCVALFCCSPCPFACADG
jgi:hypothetical protein